MLRECVVCPKCGGDMDHDIRTGEIAACDVCGHHPDARVCVACEGTGEESPGDPRTLKCDECGGRGTLDGART